MSLTDASYYVTPDCTLPQGTYNTISEHITRYESDILIQLLGYDLAKLVLAYNAVTSPQRIKDLVVGKEFTIGSYTAKWNGLINAGKVSILAYYVLIQYYKNYSITFQNTGADSAAVSPGRLMQSAGYKLRELAGYSDQDTMAGSLYNFLSVNFATYPEWLWCEYEPVNMFDI